MAQVTSERRATAAAVDAELAELAALLRMRLGRLSRQLRQHTNAELTTSQISALSSLDTHGPLRLGELARLEVVAPPTLTKVIGHLEQRGLVERREDPADRRSAVVEITRAGRAALGRIRSERNAFLARRLATLSPTERRRLAETIELLTRLAEPEGDR